VVLGTGGSSLGGQALCALRPGCGVEFFDNLDADEMAQLLARDDLARTGFLAVSKSGGTTETLSQLIVCLTAMRKVVGEAAARGHFLLIAELRDNAVRRVARQYDLEILDHGADIGGRYSVLSLVGLLPALFAGVDGREVRQGAADVLDAALVAGPPSAPAIGAALAVGLARQRNVSASVMMPYANRLKPFSAWYCQLWAESLAKDGAGTTPIQAAGPVDQHSQLQLYLAGPADKIFTLIGLKTAGRGPEIDADMARGVGADYLANQRIGDVVDALFRSTVQTLARNGRPTRVFELNILDERSLGALFMHFMLETLIAARLLGVDPLDQPAVEEGKNLVRSMLAGESSPGGGV
jgi:glucose-6-phosphate isomerase